MHKLLIINILALVFSFPLLAQVDSLPKTGVAQVSFFYPVGSNGVKSYEKSNHFSLNIIYGANGGVKGTEIGSVLNYNKGNVYGIQIGGVANITTGISKGAIIAGVCNFNSHNTSGVALAGVINLAANNVKGAQISTINITSDTLQGIQSGVINYAGQLKGIQLGVINVVGSCEDCIPVGLINIVKGGYHAFEASTDELLFTHFQYKIGVEKFYTIFRMGVIPFEDQLNYAYGIGFGSSLRFNNRHSIAIDLSASTIVHDKKWNPELNLLTKAESYYRFNLTKNIAVKAGPSFNVYLTNDLLDGKYGTLKVPETLFDHQWQEGKLFSWIGWSAGISFTI